MASSIIYKSGLRVVVYKGGQVSLLIRSPSPKIDEDCLSILRSAMERDATREVSHGREGPVWERLN